MSTTHHSIGLLIASRRSPLLLVKRCHPSLCFLATLLLAELGSAPAAAQTPITNGSQTIATLALNTTNVYTFTVTNGEAIQVRMGAPFRPLVSLYAPNGVLLQAASGSGSSSLDALARVTAATNGIFRVAVSSYYGNGTGSYSLNLAKAPGTFIVSPGDEGGTLTNGAANPGVISRGDLDMWSFEANAGDTILLRMGAPAFRPYFQIYGPGGALLETGAGGGSGDLDAYISIKATNSGAFTVIAQSYYMNNNGPYELHLARVPGAFVVSPGDDGGELVSGVSNVGGLTLGDLDVWRFSANAGENILLRMGAPGFRPWLQLYGPTGILIGSNAAEGNTDKDAGLAIRTTNSGTFTVVALGYYPNVAGPYTLTFARPTGDFVVSPGDEGGVLVNGAANPATNALGDIDLWTFTANAGDNLALRIGAPNFRPSLTVYGPSGALFATAEGVSASRDANLFLTATNSGTFTVVVQSFYFSAAGAYTLHLARFAGAFVVSPGDQGGTMTGGVSQDGVIDLGDQDLWQFAVCRGEIIRLRCEKLSGTTFSPHLQLFGRTGTLLAAATHATNAVIGFTATNSGIYTVLVDGGSLNHAGGYRLTGDGISDGLSLCAPQVAGPKAILGGVGGIPGATFILFTHTNVTAPAQLWAPILTNQFDSFGVFSHTNAFSPAELKRFFLLQQQ
jgi:hypothetical protein